jgi:hypothetical protein
MNYVIRHGRRIEIETLNPGVEPKPKPKPTGPTFVKVPLELAVKATKATETPRALVWILLLHRSWKAKSQTFPLSNEVLRGCGISRYAKRHALQQLEAAGLIMVKRLPGRSPIVTLLGL